MVRGLSFRRLQPLFEMSHQASLLGMNIGGATQSARTNGELRLIRTVDAAWTGTARAVYFDVGANVGSYSRSVSSVCGSRADIYAFEPAAATYAMLARNCAELGNVRTFRLGFGKEQATGTLYSTDLGSVFSSLVREAVEQRGTQSTREEVAVDTIGGFCARNGIEEIHLLKIDVEGAELDVLAGAGSLLTENRIHFVQFEFGERSLRARTFLKDFFDILPGYTFYRLVRDGVVPLGGHAPRHEIFVSESNFVAVSPSHKRYVSPKNTRISRILHPS